MMEDVIYVGIFVILAAWLFSTYCKKDKDIHKSGSECELLKSSNEVRHESDEVTPDV